MNAKHFFTLTPTLQEQYIYVYGELIAEIEEEDFYTSLFLVNNFYVETLLCKHSSQVLSICSQQNPEIHLMYLDKLRVNISSLVNK